MSESRSRLGAGLLLALVAPMLVAGGDVIVVPPSLSDLEVDWIGVTAGVDLYCLSLVDPAHPRLSIAVRGGPEGFEVQEYEITDLQVANGKISFTAWKEPDRRRGLQVHGSAWGSELELVLPRTEDRRKRTVMLYTRPFLEGAIKALENSRSDSP